jgi:hypothetical protein
MLTQKFKNLQSTPLKFQNLTILTFPLVFPSNWTEKYEMTKMPQSYFSRVPSILTEKTNRGLKLPNFETSGGRLQIFKLWG